MPITLEPYRPEHLPQLQELINGHLGAVVPGWALPGRFIHDRLTRHPEQVVIDPWVKERVTLCALQAGQVVAAAHFLRYGDGPEVAEGYRGSADLAWLFALPVAIEAADRLLDEVLRHTGAWHAPRVTAFDSGLPVPAFVGVPDTWPHITELFLRHGFRPQKERAEALYGGWLEPVPASDAPPEGLRIERQLGQANVCFWLCRGGEKLAHCECVPNITHGGELPSLKGWAILFELEVNQAWRNRGLGTYLVSHVIDWLRLAGCGRVVVPVAADDEARGAGRFYQRFGWNVLVREQDAWVRHF